MKFLNTIDGADKVKEDANHRFVTDKEKNKWNSRVEVTNTFNDDPPDDANNYSFGHIWINGTSGRIWMARPDEIQCKTVFEEITPPKNISSTYSTTNSAAISLPQYTKMAEINIYSQWADGQVLLDMLGATNGNELATTGRLIFRVKQLSALGTHPMIDLKLTNNQVITNTDFVAVLTNNTTSCTRVELYFKERTHWDIIFFKPSIMQTTNGNAKIQLFDNQSFSTTLPSGNSKVCNFL